MKAGNRIFAAATLLITLVIAQALTDADDTKEDKLLVLFC